MFRGGEAGFKMDLNRQQAVFEFLKHKNITGVFWNKLFKKEILNKLHFDEKLSYFEDEFLLWNILKKAKRIVLNGYADYHYTVNQNSLMNSKINTKKIENILFVKKTICDDTKTMGMDYYNLAFKKYILEIVGLINQMFYCGINEENLQGYRLLSSAAKEVGLKNLKHILGIKKKLLFVICYFKIKIPKFIYKIK